MTMAANSWMCYHQEKTVLEFVTKMSSENRSLVGCVDRKGDYHRYLAEFASGSEKKQSTENSLVAYKAASDIAMTGNQVNTLLSI